MSSGQRFADRREAGALLADAVVDLGLARPVVLGLPRGGVPVASPVAHRLHAPLDVLVARKVGQPGHPEFGIGAIAEGGIRTADRPALRALGIDDTEFDELADAEEVELGRRVATYRSGRPLPPMAGLDVVVVDDGLATGVTAAAAIEAVRRHRPARIVLAVPVCAPSSARRLAPAVDELACLSRPDDFVSVGRWYGSFDQTTDAEVIELLGRARD